MPRVILAVAVLAFTVFCVVDVVKTSDADARGLPRLVWLLLVVVVPVVGGIAWMLAGRPRTTGTGPRPRPRPQGPDDDPDFLRGL